MDTNYNIQYVYLQTIILYECTCKCLHFFVTEYLLNLLQPLELTYLYLLQIKYIMYMHYILYQKGLVNVE